MTHPAPRGVRRAGDGGAAATELVLVMPVLVAFLFLVVAAGRLVDARSDVVSAASDAARAASLQTTWAAATDRAESIAQATLAGEGITCQGGPQTTVQVAGGGGFGPGATLRVTVVCDVPTGDLALLNLPGVVSVREEAWEIVDAYRSR
ncbi:MAG TPA: TadE family protein [Acidimicrobiales bacterium]